MSSVYDRKIPAGFLCIVNYEHVYKNFAPKIIVFAVFWGCAVCSVLRSDIDADTTTRVSK